MMNDIIRHISGITAMLILFTTGFARDNNTISVTNRASSILKLTGAPTSGREAGIIIEDTQWINYTVESDPLESLKSISAFIASGDIPPGVEIYAEASHDNGLGRGKTGRPAGRIKLSNVPAVLIHEIGTSNTGNGKFHGHKVTLYTVVTDYTQIQSGDFNIYIQYILN